MVRLVIMVGSVTVRTVGSVKGGNGENGGFDAIALVVVITAIASLMIL